jgi:signal transduction histidine kinase
MAACLRNRYLMSYRIFQEALNNTIKYAEATKIEFNAICLEDKKLRITYWDNGKGFERENNKIRQWHT